MSNEITDLGRYIHLERISARYWTWYVSVPDHGYKNCEEWARTEAVARSEAEDAVRHLLRDA